MVCRFKHLTIEFPRHSPILSWDDVGASEQNLLLIEWPLSRSADSFVSGWDGREADMAELGRVAERPLSTA
jgi:hypothetical protein